ncbi:MAG: 4Fe-4S dicluster domain-containing protein [Oscillospiraceae bacterium]
MRKFDTKVQHLRYKVLREVSRLAWEGSLLNKLTDIPKTIIPGPQPTMRCCIYKERAIISERVKLALGGDKENPNVIEVIDIACDECPVGGYEVTDACRGCLAHRCEDVCPRGAIVIDGHQKSRIDKSKCVECGRCASVCPYSAITNRKRPCESACKVRAVCRNPETQAAQIDNSKCISCGACVYQCPFGAMNEKSFILDAIELIRNKTPGSPVIAAVAPSISSQFTYAGIGQVISGIRALGFDAVVEAALGADMVAYSEAKELAEKGFITSSCCPAFVTYIDHKFPDLKDKVSHNISPMAAVGRYIKKNVKGARVVFIGPCTAKKMEFRTERIRQFIDCVLTFEELQALFDSRDIDITALPSEKLENASTYGRIIAHSGGLTEAVKQGLIENGREDFLLRPVVCDGIEQCRAALTKASRGTLDGNFIEGMACQGGCVNGSGCLTHAEKNKLAVDAFSKEAAEKKLYHALSYPL